MALTGDAAYVNNAALSWSSYVIKVDGVRLNGFFGITYSHKRTRTKGYSLGKDHAPTRRSKGKYEVELVKLKGYASSMQALRTSLAGAGGSTSYGDQEFEILIQGVEGEETPITIEINRCVYAGTAGSLEEGPDLITEEIDIDCMSIKENGLTLHAPPTQQ